MSDTTNTWLARYQFYRRAAEIGFWVLVLTIHMLFNSITTWIDLRNVAFVQPLIWELTSNLTVGLLIPALVAFERRFPLRWDTLHRHLPWHLAGTLVFCVVHVLVMMALRKAAYASVGASYNVGNWASVFAYEYLKDVRSYVLILGALVSYRLLLLRLQGEARVLDAPEAAEGSAPVAATTTRPERFLVRKLRKEFLIAANDIEWLQAQGNYVGIHVNGHDYLLRSTLADFLGQLDPARFAQVHRSFAVNLDRIAEIEPLDSGDARLRMKDGSLVACSRRYRDALGSR
ncbi:LytTR family DNA-binding domain-containing protein [Polaromonas sp.]|uniref:LytTR family DNA-binding domain-containing protein n=1 Tax=Polaromonas sp. TaxID=1869339 RepID=UPI0024871B7E|nr:LytTR family DNA-binding domain-containing protein [Polaromonas sp.]MDI1272824.1 LytTR family DNA-binding domain-containing protein [Polaromonas sp.]